MSFNNYKDVVQEGDTVILYLTINKIYNVKAEAKVLNKKGNIVENVFQTPYGALKCAELVGKQFGSKISLSKGWGYILQPTPELWTLTLPHRTQIIYTPDISMIILQLELRPGSIVIESGTGSGSLSHALIRAIKPHGHLYTFDFHQKRTEIAAEEFKNHGFGNFVTVQHRDVYEGGFGIELNDKADAVFLDLPHPWQAIIHAVKALNPKKGGRICSFSPCIEQVQKTNLMLVKEGFQDIQTMEVLQTQYAVQPRNLNVLNLDFLKTEKNKSDPVSDKNETVSDKKENVNDKKETVQFTAAIPPSTLPGHTGYLTFATLPPIWSRNLQMSINLAEEENNEDE